MPPPAVERLGHERVETRHDHVGVTNERQAFDRAIEYFPDPQEITAGPGLHVGDEATGALIAGVAASCRERLAGGQEPSPGRGELLHFVLVESDETAHGIA